MLALSVRVVLAGGDQVRGEIGEGSTTQTCVAPNYNIDTELSPTPSCPYGDYTPTDIE